MKLEGRVALVTGAGQGIGKSIALAFAKEGAKVVVTDISGKEKEVLKEIEKLDKEALAIELDVSKLKQAEEAVRKTVEKFGRLDIIVNNAGIFPFKSFIEMTEAEWDKVIAINLKGTFNCTKAAVPQMIKQKYGRIINLSSIAGSLIGFQQLTHYCASKAGILGFTRALALELAPHGITVNAIAPGAIETPGTKTLGEQLYEQFRQSIPIKRWGKPEEIANLAVFLASEEASLITGQIIVADGGYSVQ